MYADDAAWRPQVLVSMLNKLIDMHQEKWESAKPQYIQELWSLGLHSRVCHVPIVLVVGADVRLWTTRLCLYVKTPCFQQSRARLS